MYVLLDKNEIKVGPREYAYSFFQKYLDSQSLEYSLPYDYNSSETIQISEDIKIVKVIDPSIPSHNALIEQLAGPYYDLSVEPVTGYFDVVPRDLTASKNELIALAAKKRYEKENGGFEMTVQGNQVKISTTKEERATWHQILTVIGEGTIKFKFSTDLWLDLVLADVQAVVSAILTHVQDSFIWEAEQIAAINAATTAEELVAIKELIDPPVVLNTPMV